MRGESKMGRGDGADDVEDGVAGEVEVEVASVVCGRRKIELTAIPQAPTRCILSHFVTNSRSVSESRT